MKKSFILYYDQAKMFDELSDEQAGKLIKCIFNNDNMHSISDGMVRIAYASLSTVIDRDNEKYTQRCEKNRENASRRWHTTEYDRMQSHPNASERIPPNAKHADSDSDSDSDNKKKKRKKKKFIPPSLEEVISFFKEKGFTEDSAKRAFNHYNLADWKDTTGKPVLSWKQKMNTVWFKEENKETQTEGFREWWPKPYRE